MIFVDTSAWCALFYAKDKYHSDAKIYWGKIIISKTKIFTSYDIFNETVTLIRVKVGHYWAAKFGQMFFASKIINKIETDDNLRLSGWDIFTKYKNFNLSFTDCLTFVIIKKFNINNIFTYDEDFEKLGVRVNEFI